MFNGLGFCLVNKIRIQTVTPQDGNIDGFYYNSNSLSVTAPSDALVTVCAYFASTPQV